MFRIGRRQAVELPEECGFRGDSVCVKKVGNAVVLLPYDDGWEPLREIFGLFSDDFMAERDQPAAEERGVNSSSTGRGERQHAARAR